MEAFEDIGKGARDLFASSCFPLSKCLRLATSTPEGLKLTTEFEIEGRESRGSIAGSYAHESSGLSLQSLSLRTDGRLHTHASLAVDPSLRLLVKAEESRQGHMGRPTSYGQLALEYDNRGVLASCNVDVVNGPTVGLAAVVNLMGGLRLGAAAALNTQLDENDRPPEVVEHALGMQFRGQGWEASLATLNKFHSVEASFMQCLGDRGKVGAILTQRLLGRSRTQMVTGGWWNVAPGSELRARISSDAVITTSFTQRMNDAVEITFSAQVKAKDVGAGEPSKFGVLISLGL